ncbi:hypothetical protein NIES267_56260 [Calothrix parasitica NIES-267]|uniref:Uncharacterized protein n=1 Tax=Calothrix parasitica NIES-267 TaxID=1973488 RepID=A0A1Z4LY40_9CYAN|nr:hypothetical protein NIES267_56260 [Calothrix parasitica NIES-267]
MTYQVEISPTAIVRIHRVRHGSQQRLRDSKELLEDSDE